nr:hypothetical protein [Tanacetum cinerariifolium]
GQLNGLLRNLEDNLFHVGAALHKQRCSLVAQRHHDNGVFRHLSRHGHLKIAIFVGESAGLLFAQVNRGEGDRALSGGIDHTAGDAALLGTANNWR